MSGEWQCGRCNAEIDGAENPKEHGWEQRDGGYLCRGCARGVILPGTTEYERLIGRLYRGEITYAEFIAALDAQP